MAASVQESWYSRAIKQRVARQGQGKSGGFRTIVAYRRSVRAVFLFGFAKNERQNLDDDELANWRRVGQLYLGLDDDSLDAAIVADELTEISPRTRQPVGARRAQADRERP